ncbi:MAG: protein kinase [bacterium]
MDLWETISASIRARVFGWSQTRRPDLPITEVDRQFSRLMRRPIGGRYRAEAPMFGQCFRAVDESDSALVILKVLPDEPDGKGLLTHEYSVCSRLSHKRIIRYHDIVSDSGFTVLVARYREAAEFQRVAGPPAEASLSRDSVGLSGFHQLQDALDYLHEQGLIHAGLSRDSVVIDRSGNVTVGNLMYSRVVRADGDSKPIGDHGRLMHGSPEHLTGLLTPESDYFAVGILLFEYLLRRHPFWRVGLRAAFERLRTDGGEAFLFDPRLYNTDRKVIGSLFSPDPAARREGWRLLRAMEARH